ncbi:MAG: ABC transporter ATP-binding protein [Clostridia bacterium]|nr:ABC transporter ATP-binding protein [Clostridia bacterium]
MKKMRWQDWCYALVCIAFIVVQVWLDMTMPDYMKKITKLIETPGSKMADIWSAGGMMLLCSLGSVTAAVITAIFSSRIGSDLAFTLRESLFKKVQTFSMEEIGKFSTASLITRSTNDIQQVLMFIVMGLQMLIKAPVTAIWAICKIAGQQWQWSLATAIGVVVVLGLVGICITLVLPKVRRMQKLTDDLNRVTRENLSGLRVVRAYNAEAYQENKFEDANEQLTKTQLFQQRTMAFMMPTMMLVQSGLMLVVYWIGAALLGGANIPERLPLLGNMMVFSQYGIMIVMAFMMLVMPFMMLPRASVAAKRINAVLDTEPTIHNGRETDGKDGVLGEVEFKNVSFRYPDAEEDVVHDISFTAKKGETVAFIGSTGCGKSTVINLVPRFYDVTEGEVLVDGVNVKQYDEHALRNKIAYVSQRAILFSGTIASNVAYGDNGKPAPTAEEIADAVDTAQASEFVEGLPETYNGYVAQGGTNFSGGQKQRLSIARAVARKAEILIFDDSFSALDYKTDRVLRKTLDRKCGDATRLIVAQRIGTIRDADKIIVLDEGRMVGIGTHEELMRDCEVYQQIALSQLSKEELA